MKRMTKVIMVVALAFILVSMMFSLSYAQGQVKTPDRPGVSPQEKEKPKLTVEKLPDLVGRNPHPDQGDFGFCQRYGAKSFAEVLITNDGYQLTDRYRNIIYKVKVVFPNGKSLSKDLSGSVPFPCVVQFEIPQDCFSPECYFTFTIDPENKIRESNKENNVVKSRCPPS